jgi:hypothetical protein
MVVGERRAQDALSFVRLGIGRQQCKCQGTMRPFHSDPKFMRWLKSLSPRDELIARIALRDDIRDPVAAKKWEARAVELQLKVVMTEDDWADLLPAVQRAKREIARQWPLRFLGH